MKIAIADDELLFRKGLGLLISEFEDMTLVFEAANGEELLNKLLIAEVLPDVLLLDLNMPVMNGIEVAPIINKNYPALRFIVLSTHYSKAFVINMIELGAASFLVKNTSPAEMEHAIREVATKGFYYDQNVMEVIRDNMVKKARPQLRVPFGIDLSDREREILQMICEEMTAKEIAEQLYISTRTVEGHRNSLLSKLNCKNTAGLVVVALQNKLVDIKFMKF